MPTSEENENEVVLRLSKEEALVFYEFVARFSDDDKLSIEDQAEECVLWSICCLFEKQLVEPLTPEYAEKLAKARDAIRHKKEPNQPPEPTRACGPSGSS